MRENDTADRLSKRFYNIAVMESPPFMIFAKDDSANTVGYDGMIVEIINILSTQLKFNYTLVQQAEYGNILPNGTWTGAIGSLIRKEVDLVAADLSPTIQRRENVDFTVPFIQSTLGVLILIPEEKPMFMDNLTTYLDPFEPLIWIAMLLLWITAAVLYHKVGNQPIRIRREILKNPLAQDVIWSSTLLTLLGIFFHQSFELPSQRPSARIILLSVCIAAFISYSFYTSVLVSFATATKIGRPVESLEDAFLDPAFQVGFTESAYVHHVMTSTQPAFKEAWARMQKLQNPYVPSTKEGVARAYKGKFAIIADVDSLRWLTFKNCSFRFLKDELLKEGLHFALPLHSPDTAAISKHLDLIIENGVMARLRSIWTPKVPPEFCKVPQTFKVVNLASSMSAIVCLALGVVTACISLCFEIIVSQYADRRKLFTTKRRNTTVIKKTFSI